MTLNQLNYFMTVCKYKSFTMASEQMHVSQPAISVAIRELENECGVVLFERHRKNIEITEAGRLFLTGVQKLMQQYSELEILQQGLVKKRNYIKIGMAAMGGNIVYPRLCREFNGEFPEFELKTQEASNSDLYEKLDNGEIDLAICATRNLPDPGVYNYVVLTHSRLMLCVNEKHRLAEQEKINLYQLQDEKLVMLEEHYNQTRYIKKLFQEYNINVKFVHYTSQTFSIISFVHENAACGFLSEELAKVDPVIVPLTVDEIAPIPITLVWRKDAFRYSSVDSFIQLARKIAAENN